MAKLPGARRDAAATPVTLVALNAAITALVEEMLRLPSALAVTTAIDLLYGQEHRAGAAFLGRVGQGATLPLATLLGSPRPLGHLIAGRIRPSATWREASHALKSARAAARSRYRELQAAFVMLSGRAVAPSAAALVRYTYGTEGRQWQCAETAERLLERVVTVNRAVLDLLSDGSRAAAELWAMDGVEVAAARSFDLPPSVLGLIAVAMPPLAVPDFAAFADVLAATERPLDGEESVSRYQSLFAEILGLQQWAGAPA